MSVQISTIFTRVRAILDDDNSVRYTEAKDLVPAANSALDYISSLFLAAFETEQIFPMVLSELTEVLILDCIVTGGTAKALLGGTFNDDTLTIVGVDPNPAVSGSTLSESLNRFAKRLTLEEWNYAEEDPFAPGTSQTIPSDFQRVCYTGPGNYFDEGEPSLLLRPGSLFSSDPKVGIWVIKTHPIITAGTTVLKFPVAVHGMIEQKILQVLSMQNVDNRMTQSTDKEIKELISLMAG